MVTYIFPPLFATGVIYEPEGNDSLELSAYVLFILLFLSLWAQYFVIFVLF